MPLIKSKYKPPFLFKNKHLQSMYPTVIRKVKDINYTRERIYTPDDDFLDLDWSKKGNERLIVLVPGLEASSRTKYIQGMIHVFNKRLWSSVVFNPRGLSGEPNNQLIQYHAGKTNDFHFALEHIINKNNYKSLVIVGFSFGANMILKYLGEEKYNIPEEIKKVACASVTCDITASAFKLDGTLYFNYFLEKFKKNIKLKEKKFPEQFNLKDWNKIKNFRQYIERYVTAYNEFNDALEYWYTTSCMHFLKNIKIPTLIINSKDDPFLTEKSYPISDAENNPYLYLELPDYGGHNGFILFNKEHEYYLEKRFVEFIKNEGIWYMVRKKIKTILFDFDGTIADTMKKTIEIYNQLALKNNFNLVDNYNLPELRNNKPLEILKKLRIPLRRLPSVANKIRKKLKSSLGKIPAFTGISEVLAKIKQMNYKTGIISTNNIKNIELFLKYNNMQYFDFIFSCREMFGKHRIIKKAIKKNNLSVDEIIYIGDEIRDINACRKIGIRIISVCWGYNDKDSLVKENAGFIAENPIEILEYL